MPKKSPEQKAEEKHRYIVACGAANTEELELFLTDPNQAIRVMVAMNPDADAEILDRFANDKFWGSTHRSGGSSQCQRRNITQITRS